MTSLNALNSESQAGGTSFNSQQQFPDGFEFNDDFKSAHDCMENTDDNLLAEGKAGTGKSTLIKYFISHTRKNVVLLAPTGIAALNIEGQTIHSFFKFPPRMINPDEITLQENTLYKTLDAIVIDEISMVRADLLDNVDIFMRLNGRDSRKPFGGAQMIFVGDLHQLPPVVDKDAAPIMEYLYESPYFFDSNAVKTMDLKTISLTKVYRQKDPEFIKFLDAIRQGNVSDEDLKLINSRLNKFSADEESIPILTTTNKQASLINQANLNRLPGRIYTYTAELSGEFKKAQKDVENLPVDIILQLKKDARVIFVKNDKNHRWVNGTLGVVIDLTEEEVTVQIDGSSDYVRVATVTWEKIKYHFDRATRRIVSEIVGVLSQIPLRLAWGMTIHRSQGQTFDKVILDFIHPVWENGHAYVALSRCRSLQGISINQRIWPNDIKTSQRVIEFLKKNAKSHSIPDEPNDIFARQSDEEAKV